MRNYKQLLKNIDTFIFDYDGVMSNGTVITTVDGEQLRTGSVKDGYAIQHALKNGYKIVIVSGGSSPSMEKRCQMLGITDYFFGVKDKKVLIKEYLTEKNIDPPKVVFMGDDIPDYYAMLEVGIAVCPADACNEIKEISKYISPYSGGNGCVRDIIEQVMKLQDKWMNDNAFYW